MVFIPVYMCLCFFIACFSYLFCPILIFFFGFALSFVFYYYSLDACLLSNRDRKGVDSNGRGCGEELGGVKGGETVIRTYCMKKKSTFNKRKKN